MGFVHAILKITLGVLMFAGRVREVAVVKNVSKSGWAGTLPRVTILVLSFSR